MEGKEEKMKEIVFGASMFLIPLATLTYLLFYGYPSLPMTMALAVLFFAPMVLAEGVSAWKK